MNALPGVTLARKIVANEGEAGVLRLVDGQCTDELGPYEPRVDAHCPVVERRLDELVAPFWMLTLCRRLDRDAQRDGLDAANVLRLVGALERGQE